MRNRHMIGAALVLVGLVGWVSQAWAVSGGATIIQSIEGTQPTSTTPAGSPFSLPSEVVVDGLLLFDQYATPPGPAPAYKDTHMVMDISINVTGSGTAQVWLMNGDPTRSGNTYADGVPKGSVMLDVYTAGTASGANPADAAHRASLETLWNYVIKGYYTSGSQVGITTTTSTEYPLVNGQPWYSPSDPVISNSAFNGLGMLVYTDAFNAKYVGIREMIKGDITGDDQVTSLDINRMKIYFGKTLPFTPGGITYNRLTWYEGDVNGDGLVTSLDLNALKVNFGKTYDPANGDLVPIGGGGSARVPEPGTWALIISGIFAMFFVRRLIGVKNHGQASTSLTTGMCVVPNAVAAHCEFAMPRRLYGQATGWSGGGSTSQVLE